ncbi:MAG: hypothetical protein ACRD3Q_15575 [Terriglobales bacterium]
MKTQLQIEDFRLQIVKAHSRGLLTQSDLGFKICNLQSKICNGFYLCNLTSAIARSATMNLVPDVKPFRLTESVKAAG